MSLKKYSTEQLIVELKRREIRAECDSALISRFVRESVNYTHAVTTDGQVFQLQPRPDDLNACIPPEDDAFAIPPRHVDNDEIMDRFIEIATREPKDMNWTGEIASVNQSAHDPEPSKEWGDCPVHNIALLGGVCHQCEREAESSGLVDDTVVTVEPVEKENPF